VGGGGGGGAAQQLPVVPFTIDATSYEPDGTFENFTVVLVGSFVRDTIVPFAEYRYPYPVCCG
jgi:hypothetical protein